METSTEGKVVTSSQKHHFRWLAVILAVCALVFGLNATPAAGSTSEDSSISKAVAWAENLIGQDKYQGYCLQFVHDAYAAAGKDIGSGYGNAVGYWDGHPSLHHAGDTNAPVGALVFWGANTYNSDGHVALSIGNGVVVSSYERSVKAIHTFKIADRNTTYGASFLGWMMPPGTTALASSTPSWATPTTNLALNGDFGEGGAHWTVASGTNFVTYGDHQRGSQAYFGAASGVKYASTNTESANGGFYQDVGGLNIQPNQTFCATAMVRSSAGTTGAWGNMQLYLRGGGVLNSEGVGFGSLKSSWRQITACAVATTAQSAVRIQFYPGIGSPTLDIDDVDVHVDLLANGGFGSRTASWSATAGSNLATYAGGQLGSQSYYGSASGARYASANTAQAGGGFYQDVPQLPVVNDTYCVTAKVRTSNGLSGAYGVLRIWQLGGAYADGEEVAFGPLDSNWHEIQTCSVATSADHNRLRVQFYVGSHGPTLDVDDVDLHKSLVANADFGSGSAAWQVAAGSNFATYASQSANPAFASYSGVRYASTNTSRAGGGIYQDVPLAIGEGMTFCVSAKVRTSAGASGAYGVLRIWQLGGAYTEGEEVQFSALSSSWQQIRTCSVANVSHTSLRVQFYVGHHGPTLDIDNVDVH